MGLLLVLVLFETRIMHFLVMVKFKCFKKNYLEKMLIESFLRSLQKIYYVLRVLLNSATFFFAKCLWSTKIQFTIMDADNAISSWCEGSQSNIAGNIKR